MRLCHPPDGNTSPRYKLPCFITTKKICNEKNALAFNQDRCCHLVLCLRLIPFHWQSNVILVWAISSLLLNYSVVLQFWSYRGQHWKVKQITYFFSKKVKELQNFSVTILELLKMCCSIELACVFNTHLIRHSCILFATIYKWILSSNCVKYCPFINLKFWLFSIWKYKILGLKI
jgi:hypothetical protein